ncbi:reverse transcriptase family protein [Microbulbifer sp. JMSA008]|uniref:reverse transcriptase family protein n=1 Tax=Microbulbifer sp. JMSA008 TaxID=3243373 RepID=UPI004039CBB9
MKNKKKHPLNQSALYKVKSHGRLATILGLKLSTLRAIKRKGGDNYYFTKLESSRDLQVPKYQLKRVHGRINELLSRIEIPEYLHSGVKKRSNVTNARVHAAKTKLLKLDIKSFYANTTEEQVFRCFYKVFRCSKDTAQTISKICCVNGILPTGSPISQSIAFWVNKGVFDHLHFYSKSRGINFTLYVDDLVFSGNKVSKYFGDYVVKKIGELGGYECHKVRLYNPKTPKIVTGVVVQGEVLRVRNRERKVISELINKLKEDIKMTPELHKSPEVIYGFHKLIGHLASVGQFNGRYRQLMRKVVERRRSLDVQAVNQNSLG